MSENELNYYIKDIDLKMNSSIASNPFLKNQGAAAGGAAARVGAAFGAAARGGAAGPENRILPGI